MLNKIKEWGGVAAAIILLVIAFLPGAKQKFGNATASFVDAAGGFRVNGTEFMSSSGFFDGSVATTTFVASTWDYLGSVKLSGTAASTSVVTIPARDSLVVCVNITSYAGTTDIASFIFNGDTGADYASRFLSVANGTTTVVDNATTSATLARLFAVGQSAGRIGCVDINNNTTRDKFYSVNAYSGTGTATSTGMIESGGGEWATSTQITSIKLTTAGGGNLATGSGFVVYGKNF